MKFSIFQDSRPGGREYNQDRLGHWYTRDSLLLVLADGMGGHLLGEVAAQIAVDTLAAAFQKEAQTHLPDPGPFLERGVRRAHAAIDAYTERLRLPDSPRTTLVACVVQDGTAWWTHVGDSRLYLVRRGAVLARTRDHTRVQQLVDQGRIREEAVSSHPERNQLLRCLGGGHVPAIEPVSSAPLAREDILLLCSDGFWGPLSQGVMLGKLGQKSLAEALPDLMSLAQVRGGPGCDNLSVVAINWGDDAAGQHALAAPITVPSYDLPTDPRALAADDPALAEVPMTDAEIEQAIADLKVVLKQHSQGKK
ncbi:MAG: PP2C family serine/threonine-protein phosphatase [Betaproteobacteria bacterium]